VIRSAIEFDNPRFVDVFVLEIVLDFAITLDRTYFLRLRFSMFADTARVTNVRIIIMDTLL